MKDEKEAKPTRTLCPTVLLAAFHGLLWIVLLEMMLKYVPSFVKIFADFDAELPVMTVWVIRSSRFSVCYWFLILPIIAVLCAADLAVLYALYLHPKAVVLRWLWLALMLLVPLGLMAWTVLAMYIPLVSLTQQLC